MSSLFTVAEVQLAQLGLAAAGGDRLDVVVGGLGLGYTARAALADERVSSVVVVEALAPVIEWHEQQLLPESAALVEDPRCRFRHADFFDLVAGPDGFREGASEQAVDVVLLDIDHTPRHVLHPSHARFYSEQGLGRLARHLRPGGVFALWSDDPADEEFQVVLGAVFEDHLAHEIRFPNRLTGGDSANTVYVARRP